MPFGYDDEKRFVIQRDGFYARFGIRLGHHNCIHIGTFEHFGERGGVVLFQDELHFRRALAQCENQFGQHIGRNRENQPQPERALHLTLLFACQLEDDFCFVQHALRLCHDALARLRGEDFVAAAVKQRQPQLFFQFFNGDGERGLADVAALGGAPEMPLLGNGNDVAQFGQGHTSILVWRIFRLPLS